MNKVKEEKNEIGGLLMGEKLKRGVLVVGKRGGNSTPSPTWKFGLIQDSTHPNNNNTLSARKLGANLWEMQPQFNLRADKMSRNNIVEAQVQSPSNSKQPPSSNKLKKKIESPTTTQHNQRVEKIGQAQQPSSSASYCSSMEMAPYRPAISPNNSSLASKGKYGESSHRLKTSTELLKVLNRIWSLEEKHALDMSLVKTLRAELGQSHAQIQELLQEKQRNQNEIDNLTEQITELKLVRNKDQYRIKDAVNLLEEKLENESKSRRRSEKRHLKLADELSGVKSSFLNSLAELECERKDKELLQDLCDEFAKGIRDYEQEVHLLKQKCTEDQSISNDRFILHISEAWLDERTQSENQSPLDKLRPEIEAFLREKQSQGNDRTPPKKPVESPDTFRLNDPASAPWNVNEEDDDSVISNALARRQGRFGNKSRMFRKGDVIQRSLREGRKSAHHSISFVEGSFDPSMFTGPSSPVKKWVSRANPGIGESSSSRWTKDVIPNTLKAKLVETRLEGPQSRASASKSLPRVG
ncbi:hypothetical protein CASFOL_033600 [Castilleja foliolosa]|uniref:Uncharacterized protein n=1 Tax=Castilleja foliolosa TaxID=1961234 RepID=A0ABD3BY80_9LAMI